MHEICTAGINMNEKSATSMHQSDHPSNKVCKTSNIVCKLSAKSLHFIKKSVHLFCQMHTMKTYAHFWKSVHETAPLWYSGQCQVSISPPTGTTNSKIQTIQQGTGFNQVLELQPAGGTICMYDIIYDIKVWYQTTYSMILSMISYTNIIWYWVFL